MTASAIARSKLGSLHKDVWLDIRDLSNKAWKQGLIVDIDFFRIKIKYKNSKTQYSQEWIHVEKDISRLEKLHTHTIADKSNTNMSNENTVENEDQKNTETVLNEIEVKEDIVIVDIDNEMTNVDMSNDQNVHQLNEKIQKLENELFLKTQENIELKVENKSLYLKIEKYEQQKNGDEEWLSVN